MTSTALRGIGVWAFLVLAITAACGDDEATGGSGSQPTTFDGGAIGCPSGTKECITDKLARVCPADGSAWLSLSCRDGEKCVDGACSVDADEPCTPTMDTCVDGTALRCRASGKGLEVIKCPPGTQCIGAGKCVGACEVGASSCQNTSTVSICSDGLQLQLVACPAGLNCVVTGTGKADCKPGDCSPGTCDVCGNKVDPNADQTKFISSCKATPLGYKWQALGCVSGASCNPKGGSACVGPYSTNNASCTSACTPGATRCSPNLNGTQTCEANGQWNATVTPCNPDPATQSLVCMTDTSKANAVICGDPLCVNAEGQCDETGKIKLCGLDRKVAATATACATGTCVATGSVFGGRAAGNCTIACQAGDERCVTTGGIGYQTCNNGVYGAPQNCAAGVCYGYTNSVGRPAKLCDATCTPGTHRCTDGTGSTGSTTHVQTCSNLGQWGAPLGCAIGQCQSSNGDFMCVAQCVPNSPVCSGSTAAGIGQYSGTTSVGTCSATGTAPLASTLCEGNKVCRRNFNGISIGCMDCMGPNHGGNNVGQADSRCTDMAGAVPGTTSYQSCQADDTWPVATNNCPLNTSCTVITTTCGTCTLYDTSLSTYTTGPCTETRARAQSTNQYGCSVNGRGSPVSCAGTPDCCSVACSSSGPGTATCK